MPQPIRTRGGDILAEIGAAQVRVHRWVDLVAPDRHVDPAQVGRVVAAIHRVRQG
jgi:hypothetical protein